MCAGLQLKAALPCSPGVILPKYQGSMGLNPFSTLSLLSRCWVHHVLEVLLGSRGSLVLVLENFSEFLLLNFISISSMSCTEPRRFQSVFFPQSRALNHLFTNMSISGKALFQSWHLDVNKGSERDCRWNTLNLLDKAKFLKVCRWLVALWKAGSFLPPTVYNCRQNHLNAAAWPPAPPDSQIPLKPWPLLLSVYVKINSAQHLLSCTSDLPQAPVVIIPLGFQNCFPIIHNFLYSHC